MSRMNLYLIFLSNGGVNSTQNNLADWQRIWIVRNKSGGKESICIMSAVQTNQCPA